MTMRSSPVLRLVAARLLVPYVLIYALYVQFHGDFGPGGGFQAGVIFAAGIIVYALVFGQSRTRRAIPLRAIETLIPLGVLIYAGTGVACMLNGGQFLEYNALAHDPKHGQHIGLLIIEFGVGLTVFSVMLAIFYAFTEPRPAAQ